MIFFKFVPSDVQVLLGIFDFPPIYMKCLSSKNIFVLKFYLKHKFITLYGKSHTK